jgi:murein DD-endopeptidase MepM/ murein hydrolase activator NlpD
MLKKLLLVLVVLIAGVVIYFISGSEVTKQVDSFVYELPFEKGRSFRVVQGYGGKFSHKNKAALDFAMPVGTPIHAARGGEIFSYKDDSDAGGPFSKYSRKANYIMIRHDDGSYGCYWHLQKNGVAVRKGKVAKGQLIGYSGNTGFVLRPHLHFAVKKVLNYEMNSFIQTRFNTSDGILVPAVGNSYTRPVDQ